MVVMMCPAREPHTMLAPTYGCMMLRSDAISCACERPQAAGQAGRWAAIKLRRRPAEPGRRVVGGLLWGSMGEAAAAAIGPPVLAAIAMWSNAAVPEHNSATRLPPSSMLANHHSECRVAADKHEAKCRRLGRGGDCSE
jgi:hypothetical protein